MPIVRLAGNGAISSVPASSSQIYQGVVLAWLGRSAGEGCLIAELARLLAIAPNGSVTIAGS